MTTLLSFFFNYSAPHRDLHSFPTRRSSDLRPIVPPTLSSLPTTLLSSRRCPRRSHDNQLCYFRTSSAGGDRKSTRLNSSHVSISYAVFCLKKKKEKLTNHHDVSTTAQFAKV